MTLLILLELLGFICTLKVLPVSCSPAIVLFVKLGFFYCLVSHSEVPP